MKVFGEFFFKKPLVMRDHIFVNRPHIIEIRLLNNWLILGCREVIVALGFATRQIKRQP